LFFDHKFVPQQIIVRYAVGGQEREAVVLANGRSLEDHVERLEALTESPTFPPSTLYVSWPLAAGGSVAIRLDSIIALEAPLRPDQLPQKDLPS
jgi:hypothetical protein